MTRPTRPICQRAVCSFSHGLTAIVAALSVTALCSAQLRVVSYNVAKLNGDNNKLRDAMAEIALDDSHGFAVAPGVFLFQEVQDDDAIPLLNLVNAGAAPGVTYALATYTNDDENAVGGAQAMIYRTELLEECAADHIDIFTRAGRNADRWHLKLVDYDSPDASFYIYGAHLKAGSGSTNEDLRESGAQAIRNDADNLPVGTHIIYGGDWNISGNTEAAYAEFLSGGSAAAFDPLGIGDWGGSSNAEKHTQSPRLNGLGALIGGGMDDRFDFLLPSQAFVDTTGLRLMGGTYRAFGNDGLHYNTSINVGNNFYYSGDPGRSNALADDLYDASDHIPVVADYGIPGRLQVTITNPIDRVIVLGNVDYDIDVSNIADVVIASASETVTFTLTGSGDMLDQCMGDAAPLAAPTNCVLPLFTGNVGPFTATANLTSPNQGVQIDSPATSINGVVLDHAEPSYMDGVPFPLGFVNETYTADTGSKLIDVAIWNHGFTSNQALLDVDVVSGAAAPLSVTAPLPTNIGALPGTITLMFDTTGLAPGLYESTLSVTTSDEDLVGELTHLSAISVSITIEGGVGCIADVNNDSSVDVDDLVEVILKWGTADANADINDDGVVDVDDLVQVILDWGCIS